MMQSGCTDVKSDKPLTRTMNSRFHLILMACLMLAINSQCKREGSNTIKDIDGNVYGTVLIGDYRWMTENLKSTRFNDGSPIPNAEDQSDWLSMDSPAYCFYQNNESNGVTLGCLYNWYAVNSGKLCPTGWRIPSDSEWMQLEGIADTKHDTCDSVWHRIGLRGFDAGQRLKSVKGWREGVSGTDESGFSALPGVSGTDELGFSALPGGERYGSFTTGGSNGYWWTSTEASDSGAYYRSLIYSFEQVARDIHPKKMGFSVRCIKNK